MTGNAKMHAHGRTRTIGGLLLASLLLLLVMAVPAVARHAPIGAEVTAEGFAFHHGDPEIETVELEAGTNVLFTNLDGAPHTLSGEEGLFDSGVVNAGGERVVSTEHLRPGTYDFFCRVHPFMKGELTVLRVVE